MSGNNPAAGFGWTVRDHNLTNLSAKGGAFGTVSTTNLLANRSNAGYTKTVTQLDYDGTSTDLTYALDPPRRDLNIYQIQTPFTVNATILFSATRDKAELGDTLMLMMSTNGGVVSVH